MYELAKSLKQLILLYFYYTTNKKIWITSRFKTLLTISLWNPKPPLCPVLQ